MTLGGPRKKLQGLEELKHDRTQAGVKTAEGKPKISEKMEVTGQKNEDRAKDAHRNNPQIDQSAAKTKNISVDVKRDKKSIDKSVSARSVSLKHSFLYGDYQVISDRRWHLTAEKPAIRKEKSLYQSKKEEPLQERYVQEESDHDEKEEEEEKMEAVQDGSFMDYTSMKHRLKAFSHKQGVMPYQSHRSSVTASMEIKNALESFHYDGPLREDSRERRSPMSTAKKSEIYRVRTPEGRHGVDDYSADQSLLHLVGPRSPASGFKADLINLSKSFGSANKRDYRLTDEDYSMLSVFCTNPNEPVEFSAHFSGTIGGKTKPWTRRHFPDKDQSRPITKQ